MEMYKPTQEGLEKFWSTLQDTWLTLYGSDFPTVAAINVTFIFMFTIHLIIQILNFHVYDTLNYPKIKFSKNCTFTFVYLF